MDKYKTSITNIKIDTNLVDRFLIDIELDYFSLEIKNLEVRLIKTETEKWVHVEMPHIWNPIASEEFVAVYFKDQKTKAFVFNQIKTWIEKQSFLMEFLEKGWKDDEMFV